MTPAVRRAARGIALVVALLLVACGADDPSVTASPSAPPPSPSGDVAVSFADIPDIVAGVEGSVVAILTDTGEGSGVVWSEDGLVVTNYHVIAQAQEIAVAFADGERSPAEVVEVAPRSDLAILDTERTGMPAATFSGELPEIGELALAMGNPLGFENTVIAGIVSGLHRTIPGSAAQTLALVDLIQTDAPISPGNSGGALVNAAGAVMGINVAYIPPNPQQGRGEVSIGFAIPSAHVVDVVEQLLETGEVAYPYLGIQRAQLTPAIAEQFDLAVESGVLVRAVVSGGPADEAGLLAGDVIVGMDGEPVRNVEDFLGVLRRHDVGDAVTLRVVREGEEREIAVELGELPS